MHLIDRFTRRAGLLLGAAFVLTACSSGGGPDWTYAPLGPTPLVTASAQPTRAPSGSSAPGLTLEVVTNDDQSLVFVPALLEAPADTQVTVNYLNNSSLPHNINFFDGPDQNSPSLGATLVVTGPNALESVTFTTPAQPGDYYFWCDVHTSYMAGTLHVTP